MLRVGIIIGSTRPTRVGDQVGKWVYEQAKNSGKAEFELVDIKDYDLPLLNEKKTAAEGPQNYEHEYTKRWSKKIQSFDCFIFVTPEYNHGVPASLKNALDYLYEEWNDKVCGFVGYGSASGFRVVESLRLICAELQMATVRNQVALNLSTDFENYTKFRPVSSHEKKLFKLIGDVVNWGQAMKSMREGPNPVEYNRRSTENTQSTPSIH